jgi:hypothetical protein
MSNSFQSLIEEYQALLPFNFSLNLEASARFDFIEKHIASCDNSELNADVLAYFLNDIGDNWKEEYCSKVWRLILTYNKNLYIKYSFVQYICLKKSTCFENIFDLNFISLHEEISNKNYDNWFFIVNCIDYIEIYDNVEMRNSYYETILESLIHLDKIIPAKEFRNVMLNNRHCLNALRAFFGEKVEAKFLQRWL